MKAKQGYLENTVRIDEDGKPQKVTILCTEEEGDKEIVLHFLHLLEKQKRHIEMIAEIDNKDLRKAMPRQMQIKHNAIYLKTGTEPSFKTPYSKLVAMAEKSVSNNSSFISEGRADMPTLQTNYVNKRKSYSKKKTSSSKNRSKKKVSVNANQVKKPLFAKKRNNLRKNENKRKLTRRKSDFDYISKLKKANLLNNVDVSKFLQTMVNYASRNSRNRNMFSFKKSKIPQGVQGYSKPFKAAVKAGMNTPIFRSKIQNGVVRTGRTGGNISVMPKPPKVQTLKPYEKIISHTQSNLVQKTQSGRYQNKAPPKGPGKTFPKGTVFCAFCNSSGDHITHWCTNNKISPQRRFKIAKERQLCLKCLFNGHELTQCNRRGCMKCGRSHHTLLHIDNEIRANIPQNKVRKQNNYAYPHELVRNKTRPYQNYSANYTPVASWKKHTTEGQNQGYTRELNNRYN